MSICWSFVEGVARAESRWSAQHNILTVSTEGRWDGAADSFHRSQLSFSISRWSLQSAGTTHDVPWTASWSQFGPGRGVAHVDDRQTDRPTDS